jgi:RimJ/RimL family protein N-acetyltransferase
MLRHAFRFVKRVVSLVGPDNRRSRRALEKIGAATAGSRRDATGRPRVLYQIAAEQLDPAAGTRTDGQEAKNRQ